MLTPTSRIPLSTTRPPRGVRVFAERQTNAEFTGALGDRVRDHTEDADRREHEGDRAEHAHQHQAEPRLRHLLSDIALHRHQPVDGKILVHRGHRLSHRRARASAGATEVSTANAMVSGVPWPSGRNISGSVARPRSCMRSMLHHPDDLDVHVGIAGRIHLELLADRVLARPGHPGERLVDDGHRWRVGRSSSVKSRPASSRVFERLEIPWRDLPPVGRDALEVSRRFLVVGERLKGAATRERKLRDLTDALDAGDRGQPRPRAP